MSEDIDFSDDALAKDSIADPSVPPSDEPEPVSEADEETASEDEEAASPESEDDTADADLEPDTDDTGSEDDDAGSDDDAGDADTEAAEAKKFAGKYDSVEALEVAYEHMQTLLGKKSDEHRAEIEELRKMIEQKQDQPTTPDLPDAEELAEAIEANPGAAFEWVANNAPDLIPQTLAMIDESNPALAKQYELEYNQYILDKRLEEAQKPLMAQYQAQQINDHSRRVYDTLRQQHEDFDALEDDIAQVMEQRASRLRDSSPEALQEFVEDCYLIARGQALPRLVEQEAEAKQKRVAQKKKAAAFESGTPGKAPDPTAGKTEAQKIADEIIGSQFAF